MASLFYRLKFSEVQLWSSYKILKATARGRECNKQITLSEKEAKMIRFEAIKINDLDQFLAQKGSANKARRHKKALEIQVQLGTPVNHGALKLPAIDVRQL